MELTLNSRRLEASNAGFGGFKQIVHEVNLPDFLFGRGSLLQNVAHADVQFVLASRLVGQFQPVEVGVHRLVSVRKEGHAVAA